MDPPGRLIETFLQSHPQYFCIDCLQQELGIPAGQISMVISRLRRAGTFTSEIGRCSRCGRNDLVVRAAVA
jgi:hypothetical protein